MCIQGEKHWTIHYTPIGENADSKCRGPHISNSLSARLVFARFWWRGKHNTRLQHSGEDCQSETDWNQVKLRPRLLLTEVGRLLTDKPEITIVISQLSNMEISSPLFFIFVASSRSLWTLGAGLYVWHKHIEKKNVDHFNGTGKTCATWLQIYASLHVAWAYARLVRVNRFSLAEDPFKSFCLTLKEKKHTHQLKMKSC